MKPVFVRKILTACLIVVVSSLGFTAASRHSSTDPALAEDTLVLVPPPIVQAAAEDDTALASIAEEAGFSAWYSSTLQINLASVRSIYRTIEAETADYIIGSVPVPDYYEMADPHVYVHRTGWILAYYERHYPVSKAVDARANAINNTKLETVLGAVAGAAGVGFTGPNYYDFRYPNATHMLLVAEHESVDNYFCIEVPSSHAVFERSWALEAYDCVLDGVHLEDGQRWSDGAGTYFGYITAGQLEPDMQHCVWVNDWCAFVVVYRLP